MARVGVPLLQQVVANLRAVARLYVTSQRRKQRQLSLQSVLNRSGLGDGPGGFGVVDDDVAGTADVPNDGGAAQAAAAAAVAATQANSAAAAAAAAASKKAAPLPVNRGLVSMPCLGPIATLSDTKQTVTVHLANDVTVVGWASHWSPRKYDVKAGTSLCVVMSPVYVCVSCSPCLASQ